MAWLKKWYITWSLSGVLLGIGFVVPTMWIVSLGGGVYFLYLLQKETSWRYKILGAWLAWTIKAAFAVGWMWTTYPIVWLPFDFGQMQLLLIFSSWFITAASLGSGALFFTGVVWLLKKQTDIKQWAYYMLLYPLLWLLGESIGSFVFSVVSYGPGGTFNTSFSFGYVGYLIAEHEVLLQVARLAGVFSLTYVCVGLMAAVLWMSQQQKRIQYTGVFSLCFVYVVGLIPITNLVTTQPTSGNTVLTIDTHLESRLRNTKEGKKKVDVILEAAVKAAMKEDPDYLVLPEDSRYFDQSWPVSEIRSFFKKQYSNPSVVLIDSSRAMQNKLTVQQAFVYNGPEDSIERFHKRYLVPQGEFFPSLYTALLSRVGYSESMSYLAQGVSYRVGSWISQSTAATNVPGILFCFESVAPQGVRTLVAERPELPFVVHIASHAWFHEPYTLWSQMKTMLRVQAVWNQQYLVTAGNMVAGNAYAPSGAVWEPEVIATGEGWQVKRIIIPQR